MTRHPCAPRGSPVRARRRWTILRNAVASRTFGLTSRPLTGLVMTGLLTSGCRSPEAASCVAEFERAQGIVMQVQSNDLASVTASVDAVRAAKERCTQAERSGEVAELDKAERMLSEHLERLREHLAKPKPQALSAEELAARVRDGDPTCPRGQAYVHKQGQKRIRCTGPVAVEMGVERAEAYFSGRGYKVERAASPTRLTVEFGAEKHVFHYAGAAGDIAAPRCIVSYPAPGVSWQEATARLTGVAPQRLRADRPVPGPRGSLPLAVDEGPNHLLVRLGECDVEALRQ